MTEQEARDVLCDYDLRYDVLKSSGSVYANMHADHRTITLDGIFTADELEAMAVMMRLVPNES